MHQPVSDIYHLRLNTGEDLISEVIFGENEPGKENHIMLLNPMKIICMPTTKKGFISLSLMQWVFSKITSEQKFNVFSRDVLTMSHPNENLKDYYLETVVYFNKKNGTDLEDSDYLERLEKELQAVEESDKMVDDDLISEDLQDIISDFINSLSSNNKGTLH
jgi:hypothetical protein